MKQNHKIAGSQRVAEILQPVANRTGAAADGESFVHEIFVASLFQCGECLTDHRVA